jgi:hypothetical protein
MQATVNTYTWTFNLTLSQIPVFLPTASFCVAETPLQTKQVEDASHSLTAVSNQGSYAPSKFVTMIFK